MTKRDEEIYEEPGPKLTVVKLSEEERRGLSTNGAQLKRAEKSPEKIYINFDLLFLCLVALIGLIVLAIKAIRWAVTS